MIYDVLIKNGKLANEEPVEVGIIAKKIVAVGSAIVGEAKEVIDLEGQRYISAGWIDGHVHCFEQMDLYYDFPDEVGVTKGVTTIIDAGSTGAKNIGDFYELAEKAKTNVLALLNISDWGIISQDELADMDRINEQGIKATLEKYPDFIVGLKARMSKSVIGFNDIAPLKLAKKNPKR